MQVNSKHGHLTDLILKCFGCNISSKFPAVMRHQGINPTTTWRAYIPESTGLVFRSCFQGWWFKTVKLQLWLYVIIQLSNCWQVFLPCIRAKVDLCSMVKIYICSYISNSKIEENQKMKSVIDVSQSIFSMNFCYLFANFWWVCLRFLLQRFITFLTICY